MSDRIPDRSAGRAGAILAAISLGRLAFGYQIQTVASLGPQLRELFALDYAALGTLIGLYLAPGALAALPAGLLARRFGDRAVLGGGLCLMAAGGLVCASGGVAGLAAGRAACGVGAVALVVLQAKVLADWFTGRAFMAAVSLAIGAYPVGVGLGQLSHRRLADGLGWQAAFVAGAVIAAAAAALFVLAYRPAPGAARTQGLRLSWPSRRECVLSVVAGSLWTAYNSGYLGFLSYVPSLLSVRGAGAATAGLAIALATWSNVPAVFAGSWLAHRIGPAPVYLGATLGLAAGVAGIAAFPHPLAWAALFGIVGSAHCSVMVAMGTRSTRPEHRAVGMSLFYTTYYIGGGLMPGLCGWAADSAGGPAGALYAAAAACLLGPPAFWTHRVLTRRAASAKTAGRLRSSAG